LQSIVNNEKFTAEPEALMLIARQSAGGMRDAISLLDQMASTGQEITLGLTQTVLGTATSQTVIDLVGAVLNHDAAAGMDAIHAALDAGTDPRLLARQLVDYLRALLLIQMGNASLVDLASEPRFQAEKQSRIFPQAVVLGMIKAFNNAAVDLRGGWQPSLPLELALAEVMGQPSPTVQNGTQPGAKPPVETQVVKPAARVSKEVQKTLKESGNPALYQMAEAEKSGDESTKVTLDQVAKAWKQISALIKPQSPSLAALLNSCKPLEIKNGVLVIGFANDLVRSKMDTTEQLEITRKAIAKVCGGDFSIKCVVSNAKQAPPANVKADGMVAAALKKGGEIVDIQE
jgi:DNA polymerase-3 subunit gamma/tau